jgi:hypothetical protein
MDNAQKHNTCMVIDPDGPETKKDCAGEGRHQFTVLNWMLESCGRENCLKAPRTSRK